MWQFGTQEKVDGGVRNDIEQDIEQCLTIYISVKLPAYPEDYFEVRSDLGIIYKNF